MAQTRDPSPKFLISNFISYCRRCLFILENLKTGACWSSLWHISEMKCHIWTRSMYDKTKTIQIPCTPRVLRLLKGIWKCSWNKWRGKQYHLSKTQIFKEVFAQWMLKIENTNFNIFKWLIFSWPSSQKVTMKDVLKNTCNGF